MNNKIKELSKKINEARNDYYNGESKVTDDIYDSWIEELKSLDPDNKSITRIGFTPISEWEKCKHEIPMGSLNKVNSINELDKWIKSNCPEKELFITEKCDGISIEVIFDNGKVAKAITRGDGFIGEDITPNVIKMKGVKNINNFTGSLRGEIILKKSDYKNHFSHKSNTRNAASGVSKRLDGVGCEHLTILFYQAIGNKVFVTEKEMFDYLISLGLNTPNYYLSSSLDSINDIYIKYQSKIRNDLDYDIDGLVVRVNDISYQDSLGSRDLRPNGAMAFKFASESKETIIREINWQVGNSGRITPVATVDKVNIMGADITHASVYNVAYINKLNINIGSTVLLVRANDVIPRIEKVIFGLDYPIDYPKNCPVCMGEVLFEGENLVCSNSESCQAQIIGRIKNWIQSLNILEWGDALIERLVSSNKIKTIADLYKLSIDDLSLIDRMGKKSAKKCFDLLWKENELTLDVFIGSLSIPMVAISSIKMVINDGYDTLEKLQSATKEDFEKVPGLGPIKANLLYLGLLNNKNLIEDILNSGVKIISKSNGKLNKLSFCFTGTMKNPRSILEKKVTDNGGEVKSSVNKNLSYLVASDLTSTKAISAKKHNVKIITEEDFIKFIEEF